MMKEIFAKWSGTWIPRGSYGFYVALAETFKSCMINDMNF